MARLHTLIYSDDSPSCLTCGAAWIDDDSLGAMSDLFSCSGDTRSVHGYPGERYCEAHKPPLWVESVDGLCEHMRTDCECDLCT